VLSTCRVVSLQLRMPPSRALPLGDALHYAGWRRPRRHERRRRARQVCAARLRLPAAIGTGCTPAHSAVPDGALAQPSLRAALARAEDGPVVVCGGVAAAAAHCAHSAVALRRELRSVGSAEPRYVAVVEARPSSRAVEMRTAAQRAAVRVHTPCAHEDAHEARARR
jgi:hypothetical protein